MKRVAHASRVLCSASRRAPRSLVSASDLLCLLHVHSVGGTPADARETRALPNLKQAFD